MFSKLSRREQDMVLAAAFALIVFILIRFMLFPFLDKRQMFFNQLESKEKSLKKMSEFELRYQEIEQSAMAEKDAVMKRDKNFTLFSFLDSLAQEAGIKENIAYMKPLERKSDNRNIIISTVKVKIDGIVMQQVVEFLHKIETSNNFVKITSLSMSKLTDENKLTVIIETETIVIE